MDPYTKNNSMDIANNQGNVRNINFLSQLEAMHILTNADVVYFQPCIYFKCRHLLILIMDGQMRLLKRKQRIKRIGMRLNM